MSFRWSFLLSLADYCTKRVKKYGAADFVFAVFGVLNYPLACIILYYFYGFNVANFVIRACATVLSLGLLLKSYWPQGLKRYYALYWYCSITFSVPVLATYLLLKNSGSLWWLMNYGTAVLVFVLIVDWCTFLVLFVFGVFVGFLLFLCSNDFIWSFNSYDTFLGVYMVTITFIVAILFARNKEHFNSTLLKDKDELNRVLEEMVASRTKSLKGALEAKDEFFKNINHEIRTPVQVISGISSLMLDNSTISESKQKVLLKQLHSNSNRLFRLVTNVLDLSKFQQGKMVLEKKLWIVSQLIQESVSDVEFLAQQKNISISVDSILDNAQRVLLDKEKIIQVIVNLLSNAIKYSKENTKIRVFLSEAEGNAANGQRSRCLKVTVCDEGVGIPEREMISIFDPFAQSSRANNKSGSSGLGLSIVAEIVHGHNGVVSVKNNECGVGSTFEFLIPYMDTESKAYLAPGKKILFVDDEQGCCIVGGMILEKEGFKVHSVSNGIDAINYLERHHKDIDMVFLDMMMPGMGGLDCLRNLQSNKNLKNIPVVIQSGTEIDKEVSKALSLGARGYISKPYVKEKMLHLVENIIASR